MALGSTWKIQKEPRVPLRYGHQSKGGSTASDSEQLSY